MPRYRTPNKVNRTFGRTAVKTKKINIAPKIMRGGERL